MEITVRGHQRCRCYTDCLPDGGILTVTPGTRIEQVLDRLGMSKDEQSQLLIFVNGRPVRTQHELQDADAVVFFHPMAGG